MKLTLVVILIAAAAGLLTGGRFANLAGAKVRWPLLALVGLALQVAPVPGRFLPMSLLYLSFFILVVFVMANIRLPGFALILVGLALNFSVIAVNAGMPVSRPALVASGQLDTLSILIEEGGAKHHLATPADELLPLGDVIPVPVVNQVVSVGDLATWLGLMWMVISCMRRSPVRSPRPSRRASRDETVAVDVSG